MSGRSLHLRDGKLITNRKTDRRQSPKRSLRERLDALILKPFAPRATAAPPEVRMAFRLPQSLKGFVANGSHGNGVTVMTGDFVQVIGVSAEQCFTRAKAFLSIVAKHRHAFVASASLVGSNDPARTYGRWLVWCGNPALVTCGGMTEPTPYEAA